MKITKAKLKQIISEELSSMSEYGGLHEDEPEMPDPVVGDIVKIENAGNMIMERFPGEYLDVLTAILDIHNRLKGMQTGAGNEVAMAMSDQ
jgi:hypothetical protein